MARFPPPMTSCTIPPPSTLFLTVGHDVRRVDEKFSEIILALNGIKRAEQTILNNMGTMDRMRFSVFTYSRIFKTITCLLSLSLLLLILSSCLFSPSSYHFLTHSSNSLYFPHLYLLSLLLQPFLLFLLLLLSHSLELTHACSCS